MIEIKCTKTQKRRIIKALVTGMGSLTDAKCLFPRAVPFCVLDKDMTCDKCLENRIKFETAPNSDRKVGSDA